MTCTSSIHRNSVRLQSLTLPPKCKTDIRLGAPTSASLDKVPGAEFVQKVGSEMAPRVSLIRKCLFALKRSVPQDASEHWRKLTACFPRSRVSELGVHRLSSARNCHDDAMCAQSMALPGLRKQYQEKNINKKYVKYPCSSIFMVIVLYGSHEAPCRM